MAIGCHGAGDSSGSVLKKVPGFLTVVLLVTALIGVSPRWASAHVRPALIGTETFNAVAATSPANAWIVGTTAAIPVHTLIIHWNGRIWRRVPSPNAAGRRTSSYLYGVAATSRRNAWAVGESNVQNISTLIEHWNGTAWKVVPSPSPNPKRDFSTLGAVAARTTSDAWAVGSVTVGPGSNSHTLIEHWNGTAWQQVPSPSITAGSGTQVQNGLGAVAAISPTNVWAVGSYIIGSDSAQTLIEHWNGTKWSIGASPDPQGSFSPTYLHGIAAISPANIFAVGNVGDIFAPTQNMILRWNGTTWKTVPSPSSPNAVEGLDAVSAASAGDAWAVGGSASQTNSKNMALILREMAVCAGLLAPRRRHRLPDLRRRGVGESGVGGRRRLQRIS